MESVRWKQMVYIYHESYTMVYHIKPLQLMQQCHTGKVAADCVTVCRQPQAMTLGKSVM